MIKLRTKLRLGFGGMVCILLVVSALCVVVLTRYSHALERVLRENYDSAVFCDAMKQALDLLNVHAQQTIWSDPGARNVDIAAARRRFADNLQREMNNFSLPGESDRGRELAALWTRYQPAYDAFDADPAPAKLALYRNTLLPLDRQMMAVAQQIADMNMANMVSLNGRVKRTLLEVRNALIVLVIAGMSLAGLVVWATASSALHSLTALTRSARQIEEGHLDLDLVSGSSDEIGQLAEAFNAMASRLREFRRLDHERLARSQQTAQVAIDSLPDGVFVVKPSGVVEITNRTASVHFGVEPGASVGSIGLPWLTALFDAVRDERKAVEPQGYRSVVQVFDRGEERFLLPRAMPMLRDDGELIGVTVILVDVTRLRQADEAKSDVVSTVSHELRTPLTSIRMALGLLAGGKFGAPSPTQEKLLTAAREDSDRLYRIVDNLLNIGRIEAGRAQFQFLPMSVRQLVEQAVDPLRPAFAEKNQQLQVDVPTPSPVVRIDAAAMLSALTNLLSNAMKFTPPGGKIAVSCQQSHEQVRITVADNGPGIAPEHCLRVFEKFFRIPQAAGPQGAGLGLAIAKEIVEAHDGVIDCLPQSRGAVFRITLAGAAPTEPQPQPMASPMGQPASV